MNSEKKMRITYPAKGGIYTANDIAAVMRLLEDACRRENGFFPQPEEENFQVQLASREGAKRAIAVSSCGTALDCCMTALGIGPGDEVITSPLTFVATASTALLRGATVVLADIDEHTFNLDPADVRRKLSPRTKCIIPVHFAGLPCDVRGFDSISREFGIPVVYDSAHALGAKYEGKPIGSWGYATCYSFQFNKLMTCLGEGGAVLTDDENLAERLRQMRTFGFSYPDKSTYEGGDVLSIGMNYQMNKVQYAVGLSQLDNLDAVLAHRRKVMQRLNRELAGVEEVITPAGHGDQHGSLHYILRINRRLVNGPADEFRHILAKDFGIETRLHYPPLWEWPAFSAYGRSKESCPIAAQVCREIFTLPVSPYLSDDECQYLVRSIKETAARLCAGTKVAASSDSRPSLVSES